MRDPDDGHCHDRDAGCFQDDGGPVDVCTCSCPLCTEAIERLLREQGDEPDTDPHGDPSGNGGAGPAH